MNKIKELNTITGLVKAILATDKSARNSDSYLYLKVLEQQAAQRNIDIRLVSVTSFLSNITEWGFAPFESVRRTRQKIQAEFPELSANKEVKAFRSDNEEAYREYARGAM